MKILVVSPFFPPSATVAIVRISSLVHKMLEEGFEVTIIRNEYDNSFQKLTKSDSRLLNLKTHTVNIKQDTKYFKASQMYKKVFREVMDYEKFDLVFITAGPYYTIPLCKISKKEYNTKVIIDYRDLWIFDMRNKKDFFKPINIVKKAIYFPIEKCNIKYADKVITVTEDWANILHKVYGTPEVKVIENGYDDNLLKGIQFKDHQMDESKIVISVFGKLSYYSLEYGTMLFNAVKDLQKEYDNIQIVHIGLAEKETDKAIELSGFNKKDYYNTGFIPYLEGMKMLQQSDINILIDVRKGAMGTKFYDYLYVNKPLIYLGKKNTQLDKLVKQFESGYSCYSAESLKNVIKDINNRKAKTLTNNNIISNYSRSRQNLRYMEIIAALKDE